MKVMRIVSLEIGARKMTGKMLSIDPFVRVGFWYYVLSVMQSGYKRSHMINHISIQNSVLKVHFYPQRWGIFSNFHFGSMFSMEVWFTRNNDLEYKSI